MAFDVDKIAERNIQEAMEAGLFDNLPGKGKPLNLDSMLPVHLQILKNANVAPDWIQLAQDIEKSRTNCARLWSRYQKEYARWHQFAQSPPAGVIPDRVRHDFAEWHRHTRETYLRALKGVNTDILKLNLTGPAILCMPKPYVLKEEMERFDAVFPALSER